MMKRVLRTALLATLLTTTVLSTACDDDTIGDCTTCKCDPDLCNPPIRNLTQREHVLTNIEMAYNDRRINWYEGVLDDNFVFFLSTGDVSGGLPENWNRADEIDLHTKLFDKNYTDLPCQKIFMDIRTEDGISWIEITPSSAPTEKWYQATLYYDFRFDISPNTYIPLTGVKAVFTVRDAGKLGEYDHHWQLVEMRDLGDETIATALANASATKPTTWGSVKAMYR